jgi:hypothetical protein
MYPFLKSDLKIVYHLRDGEPSMAMCMDAQVPRCHGRQAQGLFLFIIISVLSEFLVG